ncbi:MAG: DUF4065 domain-containing protein [Deltaproteobacteria bacterium]|nr:DUF4065 domain-containing protein [Deltaproteobacteria bacterium]
MKKLTCPKDNNEMRLHKNVKNVTFRGTDVQYEAECFVCPVCNTEAATVKQASAIQKSISDAYREKVGLLSGEEIRKRRKKLEISQQELADRTKVGIASIKRWEGSQIQTKSMDKAVRDALGGKAGGDIYTGNREFTLGRIRLLLNHFETSFGRPMLKENDRGLYAAKYAWYADMIAYRDYGESISGSTYAALPQGPQINNYRDLIDEIKHEDTSCVDPLTTEEAKIVRKIVMAFPKNRDVYAAAHREIIWKEKTTGALIPYSDAIRLTELLS